MRTIDIVRRERKRNELLDAAVQCFAEQGYEGTRTADICARAGMSAGNLFHYFASKHEVMLAAIERDGERTAAGLTELGTSGQPFAALLGLLDHVCILAADRIYAGFTLEVAAQAHRDQEVATRFKANDRSFRRGLEELVRAADGAGELQTDLTVEQAATWLAALTDGMFARVSVDPEFDPVAETIVLRGIVQHLLQNGVS